MPLVATTLATVMGLLIAAFAVSGAPHMVSAITYTENTSCTIDVDKNPVDKGDVVTVVWNSFNATSATLNGVSVPLQGSQQFTPTTDMTFTIVVEGPNSSSNCSVQVDIWEPIPVTSPTCTLKVAPVGVPPLENWLVWTTEHANTVTIDNGIGEVSAIGSILIEPAQTTTYTLTAVGDAHTTPATCTYTHTITPPTPTGQCTLDIEKSVDLSYTTGGNDLSYTLTVKNIGNANCTNVHVRDDIPAGITKFVSETHTTNVYLGHKGYQASQSIPFQTANQRNWGIDTLSSGETARVTWVGRVAPTSQCQNYAIENIAYATADELNHWFESNKVTSTVVAPQSQVCGQVENPLPLCTLTPAQTTIAQGGNVTFVWTSANASSVKLNGVTVATNGSQTVSPTQSTTYTLIAASQYGQKSCSAQVNVQPVVEPHPPVCESLTASPTSLVGGGTTTLTWDTTNASSVTINNGVGSVPVDGSVGVAVSATTNFVLTATNADGTDTCSQIVTVTAPPTETLPICESFTASPDTVSTSRDVTLTWNTTNATSVIINNGIGSVAVDGSTSVFISDDITYTLTASNGAGQVSCTTHIERTGGGGGGGGGGSVRPRCELAASAARVPLGGRVTLSWDNDHTSDITLEDNRGNVLVDTEESGNRYDEDKDSIEVTLDRTTTYTLTALFGSRKDECEVEVTAGGIVLSATRDISLADVPYTGFDAGPFLTTLFYTILVLWSIGVAYVLVVEEGTVFGFSLTRRKKVAAQGFMPTFMPQHSDSLVAAEVASAVAPVAVLPEGVPTLEVAAVAPAGVAEEESETATTETESEAIDMLEERAHESQTLLSSEAIRFILAQTTDAKERLQLLETAIAHAKKNHPSDDGWVVVNKERITACFA